MLRHSLIAILLLATGTPLLAEPHKPPQEAVINIGGHRITVELAVTFEERRRGLMGRTSLPDNHGMLFVYNEPREVAFWMKQTLLPLDILYFNENAELVQHYDNVPPCTAMPCVTYPSRQPIAYVLELSGGSRAKLPISIGDTFNLRGR